MLYFSNAKINLGLHITEKRSDGFHNLETVFLPILLADLLELQSAPEQEDICLHATGINVNVPLEQHLCVRAFRLLQKDFALSSVNVFLHKLLPYGAGLGGGSSNAAFMLRALNELFSLQLSKEQLCQYAAQLGSDCAFFVHNTPMLAKGRGEILKNVTLDLRKWHIFIVKPTLCINTAQAYASITPKLPKVALEKVIQQDVKEWKEHLVNDFEVPIFAQHPQLARIKQELYRAGASYAAMSGSGSALFGFFAEQNKQLSKRFTDCQTYWTNVVPSS
ncbi:MAG: 4-(cytidine 5'-diphospho)-2-C-methyl-D-erythritol kinase [Bacteroidales bacterium]